MLTSASVLAQEPSDGFSLQGDKAVFEREFRGSYPGLLAKAREWAMQTDSTTTRPAVINSEDRKNGKLTATRYTRFDSEANRGFVAVAKWLIEEQPGGYRLTISDIRGYQTLRYNDRLSEQPFDANALLRQGLGGSGPYKPPFVERYAPSLMQHLQVQSRELEAFLKNQ